MTDRQPQFLDVPSRDGEMRRIAYLSEPGEDRSRPGLVWFSGFNSVMTSTKASALAGWAATQGLSMVRFDYSGHGQSGGAFTDGTIGQWLEESIAVLKNVAHGPQILVGSSMGGWIVLLILRAIANASPMAAGLAPVRGAVLIAPAWDMTQELMWSKFSRAARNELTEKGAIERPSRYEDGPYIITRTLIEEGRNHLIGGGGFDPRCPVRIMQGVQDPDVPWRHAYALLHGLETDDVMLSLVDDGDHRLSRPPDIAKLLQITGELYGNIQTADPGAAGAGRR